VAGGAEPDQNGVVDLRGELGWPEDAGDIEPLPADPDALAPVDVVDAEAPRGHRAQDGHRFGGGRRIQVGPGGQAGADDGGQAKAGRLDRKAIAVNGGNVRAAVGTRADGPGVLDAGDGADPGDHAGRGDRELGGITEQVLPVSDGEQVRAQAVYLREQPRLRG